jgi:hypothetical protein
MYFISGGLLSWLAAQWNKVLAKWIALLTVLINFAITTNLWFQHSGAALTGPKTGSLITRQTGFLLLASLFTWH